MYYLEINNDLYTSGIKNEFGEYINENSSDIPIWVFEQLSKNKDEIEKIISAGNYKSRSNFKTCFKIDMEGFEIKDKLEKTGLFKVKYYSLFLNRYLFQKPDLQDYPRPNFWDKVRNAVDDLLTKNN